MPGVKHKQLNENGCALQSTHDDSIMQFKQCIGSQSIIDISPLNNYENTRSISENIESCENEIVYAIEYNSNNDALELIISSDKQGLITEISTKICEDPLEVCQSSVSSFVTNLNIDEVQEAPVICLGLDEDLSQQFHTADDNNHEWNNVDKVKYMIMINIFMLHHDHACLVL